MKRELKFRAWDNFNRCFHYTSSEGVTLSSLAKFFTQMANMQVAGNGIRVSQYTGLKDKNGKEIYEFDRWGKVSGTMIDAIVIMHEGCWSLKWSNGSIGNLFAHVQTKAGEVIGNLYENPALHYRKFK